MFAGGFGEDHLIEVGHVLILANLVSAYIGDGTGGLESHDVTIGLRVGSSTVSGDKSEGSLSGNLRAEIIFSANSRNLIDDGEGIVVSDEYGILIERSVARAGLAMEGVGEAARAVVASVPKEVVDTSRDVHRGEEVLRVNIVDDGAEAAVCKHVTTESVQSSTSRKPS